MSKLRKASVALLAGAALMLAACSGGETEPGTEGGLEQAEITVGALPLADYAAVYWAQDHGFFEAEGLTVELEPLQGGSIGIQKVATGEIDFSITNAISQTLAISEGVPIVSAVLSSGLGTGSQLIVVLPDSPIQTFEDLDGKTLGINNLNNMGDVMFQALAEDEGIDAQPNFIEVPFPEMVPGVQAGSIDAGYVPEPFASVAKAEGLRVVGDLAEGPNEHLPAANFITSKQFADQNPETTQAFIRAMYAAGQDIRENEQEFRDWLPNIANVPDAVAQEMILPVFYEEMDVDALQAVADTLHSQGRMDAPVTMADHVVLQEDN